MAAWHDSYKRTANDTQRRQPTPTERTLTPGRTLDSDYTIHALQPKDSVRTGNRLRNHQPLNRQPIPKLSNRSQTDPKRFQTGPKNRFQNYETGQKNQTGSNRSQNYQTGSKPIPKLSNRFQSIKPTNP